MNCEYCLAPISLEDQTCPHCGRPNYAAMKHAEDIAHYKSEFTKTQSTVFDVTNKFKSLLARAIIFSIVLIVMIISILLNINVYSFCNSRINARAIRNEKLITNQVEQMLEQGDYLAVSALSKTYRLTSYRINGKSDYYYYRYPIFMLANNYENFFVYLSSFISAEDKANCYSTRFISDSVNSLYKSINYDSEYLFTSRRNASPEDINEATNTFKIVSSNVLSETEGLLIRYLNFTPDEARALNDMTETQRSISVEQKIMEAIDATE